MSKDKVIEMKPLTKEPNETLFDEILDNLTVFNGEEDYGLETIGALMAMPDDEFNTLSEPFLIELEKSLNNPGDRILLQQALRESGKTAQELAQLQDAVLQEIDEKLVSELPQNKIDFLKRMMVIVTNIFTEADGIAKSIITIPIELCKPEAIKPTYAHDGDAAMDIYSPTDITIDPGKTFCIMTGIKVAIPKGYALLIQPRSGQSLKTKLRVANTPGLIDSGYRDEIGVIVENIEPPIKDMEYDFLESGKIVVKSIEHGKSYTIEKGQRIAQMRLVEVPSVAWMDVENVGEIGENRLGGFGSTGK